MAKTFDDFLTEDKFEPPAERAPASVLDELKSALAAKVKYRLDFQVSTSTAFDSRVVHSFRVVIESLGYSAELFKVSHNILSLYPAKITGVGTSPQPIEVQDEDELVGRLGEFVQSDKFNKMIGTLLAQV